MPTIGDGVAQPTRVVGRVIESAKIEDRRQIVTRTTKTVEVVLHVFGRTLDLTVATPGGCPLAHAARYLHLLHQRRPLEA